MISTYRPNYKWGHHLFLATPTTLRYYRHIFDSSGGLATFVIFFVGCCAIDAVLPSVLGFVAIDFLNKYISKEHNLETYNKLLNKIKSLETEVLNNVYKRIIRLAFGQKGKDRIGLLSL